jgi:alpha-tubulin suppressor-like RCC1 family protein
MSAVFRLVVPLSGACAVSVLALAACGSFADLGALPNADAGDAAADPGVLADGGKPGDAVAEAAPPADDGRAPPAEAGPPPTRPLRVAASGDHACALLSDGAIMCWGSNNHGQLGDGTTIGGPTPVRVRDLPAPATALSLGGDHSCALLATGALVCWGASSNGEVGNGSTGDQPKPVVVNGLASNVTAVACDNVHTCAIRTDGAVRCWGEGRYGALGDGTSLSSPTPVATTGLTSAATALALGFGRSCALLASGSVVCWGLNDAGQLGDGTKANQPTPVEIVPPARGAAEVSVGWWHTCVRAAGTVRCRGYNGYGELGDGSQTDDWSWTDWTASVDSLGSDAAAVSASLYHSCAVRASTGGVVCWGSNNWGQLGDGSPDSQSSPRAVSGLGSKVVSLGVGGGANCALQADGAVRCWGLNQHGQLGASSADTCGTGADALPCSRVPLVVSGLL